VRLFVERSRRAVADAVAEAVTEAGVEVRVWLIE
jgi:hypothetical protein